jgi:hypothetical protein
VSNPVVASASGPQIADRGSWPCMGLMHGSFTLLGMYVSPATPFGLLAFVVVSSACIYMG